MSNIEWTEQTWNPVVGCEVTSPGCKNCYAMRMAGRLEKMQADSHYKGTTETVKGKTVWTGKVAAAPESVWQKPLRRRKPTVYFVNSMGDLFHPNVADELIDRVFAVMALSPQHKFQILTKHPKRMRDHLRRYEAAEWCDLHAMNMLWSALDDSLPAKRRQELEWLLNEDKNMETGLCFKPDLWPHVWLGVSVESADYKWRIDILRQTRAAIRFVSFEPLIGPIGKVDFTDIHWAIVGGESGPKARPSHPDWVRDLCTQSSAAAVAFFFKQWGAWAVHIDRDRDDPDWRRDYETTKTFRILNLEGGIGFHGERVHRMVRLGKKAAGRLLDGVEHNAMPEVE